MAVAESYSRAGWFLQKKTMPGTEWRPTPAGAGIDKGMEEAAH
jgi:hypothetical protein